MNHTHDAHCRKPACGCDHTSCYRGWIDTDPTGTTPCHTCRPTTWQRWHKREQARANNYPTDALNRIMQGQ